MEKKAGAWGVKLLKTGTGYLHNFFMDIKNPLDMDKKLPRKEIRKLLGQIGSNVDPLVEEFLPLAAEFLPGRGYRGRAPGPAGNEKVYQKWDLISPQGCL